MNFKFITLTIFIIIHFANGLTPLVSSENYSRSLTADDAQPNQYQVFWKKLNDDEIQFEIHVKTLGTVI